VALGFQPKFGVVGYGWLALILALLAVPAVAATSSVKTIHKDADQGSSDQWEFATTADDSGHVYAIYPQSRRDPNCATCWLPSLMLITSHDSGAHWDAPRSLTPFSSGQANPQIVVDAADHRTVYAAWLENMNRDVMVAKSSDFGQSWSVVMADRGLWSAEHPVLAARGQDVYVGFTRTHSLMVATSHNGGVAFGSAEISAGASFAASLADSATVDNDGNIYLAWAGYTATSATNGRVHLYISRLLERGGRWATTLMDTSRDPEGCSAYQCAWGYLGAQISLTSDSAGVLYALWNASSGLNQAERIYFASSTTRGEIWSQKVELSNAPTGATHTMPLIAASSAGTVRVAWMDSRFTPDWSAFYRTSTNGGATWSDEKRVPTRALASLYAPTSSTE